jgi:hypothetical protein
LAKAPAISPKIIHAKIPIAHLLESYVFIEDSINVFIVRTATFCESYDF